MHTVPWNHSSFLQNNIPSHTSTYFLSTYILKYLQPTHLAPLHNVYSALVYSANGSDVDTVIIDGNVVMENRKILTVDEGEIVEKARLSARRIFAES